MCAVTFQTNAQTKAEQLLKDAEAKCKVADKKLKDWKAQYDAAFALGDGKLISIPVPENLDDKENRPEMNYNFKYNDVNPRLLEDTPDLTPIKNFQPDAYNDILRKYNEFIKK